MLLSRSRSLSSHKTYSLTHPLLATFFTHTAATTPRPRPSSWWLRRAARRGASVARRAATAASARTSPAATPRRARERITLAVRATRACTSARAPRCRTGSQTPNATTWWLTPLPPPRRAKHRAVTPRARRGCSRKERVATTPATHARSCGKESAEPPDGTVARLCVSSKPASAVRAGPLWHTTSEADRAKSPQERARPPLAALAATAAPLQAAIARCLPR